MTFPSVRAPTDRILRSGGYVLLRAGPGEFELMGCHADAKSAEAAAQEAAAAGDVYLIPTMRFTR